jgi:hypothetical protein
MLPNSQMKKQLEGFPQFFLDRGPNGAIYPLIWWDESVWWRKRSSFTGRRGEKRSFRVIVLDLDYVEPQYSLGVSYYAVDHSELAKEHVDLAESAGLKIHSWFRQGP